MGMPPKNYFSLVFWKILFYAKKLLIETKNIQNLISYKKVILIFVVRRPLPLKTVMLFHKWFSTVFSENFGVLENIV